MGGQLKIGIRGDRMLDPHPTGGGRSPLRYYTCPPAGGSVRPTPTDVLRSLIPPCEGELDSVAVPPYEGASLCLAALTMLARFTSAAATCFDVRHCLCPLGWLILFLFRFLIRNGSPPHPTGGGAYFYGFSTSGGFLAPPLGIR